MSSTQNRSGLLSSSSFRLAALYALLLACAFAATALVARKSAISGAERNLQQRIELEVASLSHEFDVEGPGAVRAAIASRAERPGALEYWLTDSEGRRTIGDIPALAGADGWQRIELSRESDKAGSEGREDLLVFGKAFADGGHLSVGGDLREGREIVNRTISILARIGLISVTLVLLAGYMLTRNSLRRISDILAALAEASAGNLSARVPERRQFFLTDLEQVSRGINIGLERNENLVDGLRRVTRDIAHDLRTPLFHLSQRLEQALKVNGSAKDREIASASEKMAQIISTFNALLRLAEIESGAARTRFGRVDLSDIAETIADAFGPDAELTGHEIKTDIAPGVTTVGDRDLLTQALANLVGNALKYSPAGQPVIVFVSESDGVKFGVKDFGAGIPEDLDRAVLQPFFRLDESRSTPGAGLGLSIVKAIADQHEAELIFERQQTAFVASVRFAA